MNKGTEQQHHEIENALAQALRYTDIGIHIRDAGKEWFPTLSPREEDLLRRCVLSQPSTLGVDIRWWSADRTEAGSDLPPMGGKPEAPGWAKLYRTVANAHAKKGRETFPFGGRGAPYRLPAIVMFTTRF